MARLLAACNSVSYLLFSLIGIPNVERWGRRKMLMYAALGQGLCYMLITILLRFSEMPGYPHQREVASASVAFFFLYYVFFGIGFQGESIIGYSSCAAPGPQLALYENQVD
jgi:MFS family permease